MLSQMPDKNFSETIDLSVEWVSGSGLWCKGLLKDGECLSKLALGQGFDSRPYLDKVPRRLLDHLRGPLEEELCINSIVPINKVHKQLCSVI